MLARQRQDRILREVREHGGVRVAELTGLLNVSDMTVRLDLSRLAGRGLVEKVHGGATSPDGRSSEEPGFEARSMRQQAEKVAIARAAACLVSPGMAVGLSAGTTTAALAGHLCDIPDITVVTNSFPVAEILRRSGRTDVTVVLSGGVPTSSQALVGPVADAALRSLHVDLLFMGVHGMDEHDGFTSPNLMEAETDRAFLASASRLVVVADSTKWGVVGLCRIARLDDVDVVITDSRLPVGARAALAERVPQLITAGS